ncbi:MAG: carboxylesterase family protein [Bacteroidetes bacterium]|nr:carboxylesterase family protein [Bacteroidota bacterium]
MKYIITCIALLLINLSVHAQQWIDKKYTYDSTYNVFYGTATNFNGGTDSLRMDIYTPRCNDPQQISRRPLLLIIHGGAFIEGSKNDPSVTYLSKEFAKRGYVTANINYRLGFVSDDTARTCNYPNYSCVFATDTAEWYRAYYRGIQDAKGALRYMINRNQFYRIDTANVFVMGESAGAFIALGVALMDTLIEKPSPTGAIAAAPNPHASTLTCSYNATQTFSLPSVARPDLGPPDGSIEPTTVQYTIKGVGNIFGGMLTDLLQYRSASNPAPAIFSFHQPCDPIVPIDQGRVYQYLNWCFTNGYGCFGISNTPVVRGSRAISNLNTANNYGYTIQNNFTTTNFPFNYWIGPGSCLDQVNNPCHAYDNALLRETNLATFFAGYVSTFPVCDTGNVSVGMPAAATSGFAVNVFPNPFTDVLEADLQSPAPATFTLTDIAGREQLRGTLLPGRNRLPVQAALPQGIYLLHISSASGQTLVQRVVH